MTQNMFANPIPSELYALLGSSIIGSSMRLISFIFMARHYERVLTLRRSNVQATMVNRARMTSSLQLVRRIIALSAVFFVIVWPKLVAVFCPNVPITIGITKTTRKLFSFCSGVENLTWIQLHGVVITPLDTHLLSAIMGLYFGYTLVDFKR